MINGYITKKGILVTKVFLLILYPEKLPTKNFTKYTIFKQGIIHKPRGQIFEYIWFTTSSPPWSLLQNRAYVIKRSFGQPHSPFNCPRSLCMNPIKTEATKYYIELFLLRQSARFLFKTFCIKCECIFTKETSVWLIWWFSKIKTLFPTWHYDTSFVSQIRKN